MNKEIESKMIDKDWENIKQSKFVDIAKGVSSFALIFENEHLGLHGFQVKYGSKKSTLEPKSFNRKDTKSCPDCGPVCPNQNDNCPLCGESVSNE